MFMSAELLAILITAAFQLVVAVAGFVILGTMLRTIGKVDADDAAMFLQGRRVEEVIREMRETLRKKPVVLSTSDD
jgi:uncharacterized membrane protein YfbV (UPF0208 family)